MNIKQTYILLLVLVVFQNMNAQVQKLYELSRNKYLGMKVILNEKKDDVWGYCVLYQKDKVEKDVLDLELVILDNNLNKVGSTGFQQFFFNSGMKEALPKITEQNLKGNTLYFSVGLSGMFSAMPSIYRKLDLTDFTVSEPSIFLNGEIQPFSNTSSVQKPAISSGVVSLGTAGYVAYIGKEGEDMRAARNRTEFQFSVLDLDFKTKWSGTFKKPRTLMNLLTIIKPIYSNDYLLIIAEEEVDKKLINTYDVYDIVDGTKITNFRIEDENYLYSHDKFVVKKGSIVSYDFVFENNKKNLKDESKIIGYSEKTFHLKDGTSSQKILKWDAFKEVFEIDEFGKINKEFYIHPMTVQTLTNGNKLMFFEGFKPAASTQILDLFAVEFDKDFKMLQFAKIVKYMNRFNNLKQYGSFLKTNGYFDYAYTQKLGEDTYASVYTDNEKARDNSTGFKQNWVMGITTFAEGVFATQKLTLNSKDIEITTEPAKKGYILLNETNTKEKTTEIRLEKINY
jgi:hypothetical protein